MKKLIFILALLLMAAPAWSQVAIDVNSADTWNDEEDPNVSAAWIEFKYGADLEGELIRAFALEVNVSGPNAFISWAEGLNGAYNIAPGGFIAETNGNEDEEIPQTAIVLEMASLYNLDVEDGIQPDPNGMLFGIEVTGDQGGTVCVTVALNAIRGGIVMEDATEPDGAITITGGDPCCVTLAEMEEEEPECAPWLDQAELDALDGWITALEDAGLPVENVDNWCMECFPRGDQDKDGFITFNDFSAVFQDFVNADSSTDPNAADSDIDMDGFITFNDFSFVFQNFKNDVNCLDLDGYPLE